ncbi:MAG: glycosyltransferase family 2 protein [Alphaproteobacteria bacterium]|nr:glycosyltransferase family 2 protein [Alphaproteobacteria bacterium]MBV8410128.1 glycosyltransferase family 2 protein [Alphaproteobacteria bacterium]
MTDALTGFCLLLIVVGMVPTLMAFAQFVVIGWHGLRNHYSQCRDYTPRVAFVLPAWNEADVLGSSIDSLMSIDYPAGAWRIYVVDDASTDHTPDVMREKMAQYEGSVFHLRREKGGQGKAHTLNHGIRLILEEGWAEAVMIMDADVLFEPLTLRRMVRHLADPKVGGVTAYVKEGSYPGSLLSRYIAFEYITAQAAARRAQNVMGGLACMAGGAQLHSRENLIAIGGAIDTTTLAEDTFTTFKTQLAGRRALFDANAIVWAEEPDSVTALWKQRVRWGRGNLQITKAFRELWFHPNRSALFGNIGFGILWFSVALMPAFALLGSFGLVGLYYLWPAWAWEAFSVMWSFTFFSYLFQTLFSFAIDPAASRRAWFEGLTFPGLLAIAVMVTAVIGLKPFADGDWKHPQYWTLRDIAVQVILGWTAISTALAYGVYRLDKAGAPKWLRDPLLVLVGYGPLLCAIAVGAIIAEVRNADLKWDKTIKSGKARIQT